MLQSMYMDAAELTKETESLWYAWRSQRIPVTEHSPEQFPNKLQEARMSAEQPCDQLLIGR